MASWACHSSRHGWCPARRHAPHSAHAVAGMRSGFRRPLAVLPTCPGPTSKQPPPGSASAASTSSWVMRLRNSRKAPAARPCHGGWMAWHVSMAGGSKGKPSTLCTEVPRAGAAPRLHRRPLPRAALRARGRAPHQPPCGAVWLPGKLPQYDLAQGPGEEVVDNRSSSSGRRRSHRGLQPAALRQGAICWAAVEALPGAAQRRCAPRFKGNRGGTCARLGLQR